MQAVGFPFVVEFGLDDGQQSFVELEQRLDLCFVLGVEFSLLLYFVEDGFDCSLQLCVLVEHVLHYL